MDNFKTWFNSTFSLSLNGKLKGLEEVSNLPLFNHKLNKVLHSTSLYGFHRKKADIITMRVSGQTCKLYYRQYISMKKYIILPSVLTVKNSTK